MATNNRRRTQRAEKGSPYLYVAIVLALIALVLLVVIVVVAFTEPSDPPEVSEPSASESSSIPVNGNSTIPPEASSQSEASVPPEVSEPVSEPVDNSTDESEPVSVEPPVPGTEPPEQPASALAYEQRVGKAYSIDMNPWEQYVAPQNPMEYVFLVDSTHTLESDFEPADLVRIKDMKPGRPDYYSYMRACAEKALQAFLEEGRQYGINDVGVSNGYRSYASQRALFEGYKNEERARHPDYTEEEIEALVLTYSLRPGTSEHQSGLCVDMHNRSSTDMSFAGTEAALWLEANCYRFGFVLRYPEDKEDITTVMFEPWHFRFVGREAATEMHDLGMCLEEYCAYKGIV